MIYEISYIAEPKTEPVSIRVDIPDEFVALVKSRNERRTVQGILFAIQGATECATQLKAVHTREIPQ